MLKEIGGPKASQSFDVRLARVEVGRTYSASGPPPKLGLCVFRHAMDHIFNSKANCKVHSWAASGSDAALQVTQLDDLKVVEARLITDAWLKVAERRMIRTH